MHESGLSLTTKSKLVFCRASHPGEHGELSPEWDVERKYAPRSMDVYVSFVPLDAAADEAHVEPARVFRPRSPGRRSCSMFTGIITDIGTEQSSTDGALFVILQASIASGDTPAFSFITYERRT